MAKAFVNFFTDPDKGNASQIHMAEVAVGANQAAATKVNLNTATNFIVVGATEGNVFVCVLPSDATQEQLDLGKIRINQGDEIGLERREGVSDAAVHIWANADAVAPQIVRSSADQDPVFNHTAGVKTTNVTASVTILTPPAGCKYARISATGDGFIRTDGQNAGDDSGSIRMIANNPEIVPVQAGVIVKGFAAAAVTFYATPLKDRP